MEQESKATSNDRDAGFKSNSGIELSLFFDFEGAKSEHLAPDDLTGKVDSGHEKNCIFIFDDKVFDAVVTKPGKAVYIDIPSLKISSPTFETLTAGIWSMLPVALGISIDKVKGSPSISL
jgi:hypothetical protein